MLVWRRLPKRSFASKDPTDLRKQFEKLAKDVEKTTTTTVEEPEIKVKDQKKLEDDLKRQFKDLSEGLAKETGEAKSAFQRMKDSYGSIKAPSFSQFASAVKEKLKPKVEEVKTEAKTEAKTETKAPGEEEKGKEKPGKEKEGEGEAAAKRSIRDRLPGFSPITNIGKRTSEYMVDAIRETFPTSQYKMEQMVKRQQQMAKEKELMDKFLKGEISGEDAKIPEWKRGALQPVQQKRSIFQKAKDKVQSSIFGMRIESTAKKVAQSPQIKSVQEGIDKVKTGIEDIKEGVKEDLDSVDSHFLNRVRNSFSGMSFETEEARAVKLLRAYDADFDVFALESMMEGIVEDLLKKLDERNWEAIEMITEGQARLHFISELSYTPGPKKKQVTEVVDISKATYLGTNLEDKTKPKFSFSVVVKVYVGVEDKTAEDYEADEKEAARKAARKADEVTKAEPEVKPAVDPQEEFSFSKEEAEEDEKTPKDDKERPKIEEFADKNAEQQAKKEIHGYSPLNVLNRKGRVRRLPIFLTICRNDKYSPEIHTHPWTFLVYRPMEDSGRLQ